MAQSVLSIDTELWGQEWEADAVEPKRNRKRHSFGRAGVEMSRQSRRCSAGTKSSYLGQPGVFLEIQKTPKMLCRTGFFRHTAMCGVSRGAPSFRHG